MKRTFASASVGLILLIALLGAVFVYGLFSVAEVLQPAGYIVTLAEKPSLSAKSWTVFDVESGDTLFEHNATEVLPIASITKLFTASQLFKNADLAASTSIVWSDVVTEGRAGKLAYGDTYTNRELLFPLLLESSNDAATALYRVHPTLLEDVRVYLEGLSLSDTYIDDASGLSDENVSTARDLAKITQYMFENEPKVFDVTQLSAYYANDNGWINNSPFIEDDAYRGGKHGFTYAANRTVVAFFEENISGTERILGYILLGSDDLVGDMTKLRAYTTTHATYR